MTFDYWIAKYCVEEGLLRARTNGFIDGKLVFVQAQFEYLGYFNLERRDRELFQERLDKMIIKIN
jgi:hypothetical protein